MAKRRFYQCKKQIWLLWNLNMKKHSDLAFKFRNTISLGVLWENSEQKIIYAEKRVNIVLINVEQKIILCKIVKIVYAKNSEQLLWENNEQF